MYYLSLSLSPLPSLPPSLSLFLSLSLSIKLHLASLQEHTSFIFVTVEIIQSYFYSMVFYFH